jgi:hypothetical protein
MTNGDQGEARTRDGGPARAVAVTVAVAWAVLTAALGYIDGTGLFAPENWLDAGAIPTFGTSPAWATVVYLPLLIVGGALVCHRIVRGLSPGAPARWAFWATWSGIILTAFLAKLAYTLVLIVIAGPHALHVLPTLGAVLAQCGLSAAKSAVLGLLAAGPAAIAYKIAARRTPASAESAEPAARLWSPIWFLVGAAVAAKATASTSAWMGGPIHRVILPIAGAFGAFAVAWMLWNQFGRRLAGRAGWALWATTAAASALGFLLAWLVDAVVNGFGGGLFPVIGVLTHLGAGALAGIVTSAVATAGGWGWSKLRERAPVRWTDSLSVSARSTLDFVLVIAACLGLGAGQAIVSTAAAAHPVPGSASTDAAGLLALTVNRDGPPIIADSAGRQVLLRGVNVNQLIDYGQRDPAMATVRPLTEADYADMAASYGFNVQRLGLSWSALEPTRGVIDQGYVARVRAAVDQAARHGIYTVLDMHQDTFSKYVTATPGTTCRPMAEPEFGNDGAPDWATITNGAKGCGFMGRDLSPNVQQAFTNLYADTDGIGAEFARAWGSLAEEFAGDTAVVGYDLLNEPGPGNAPGVTSSVLLGRLYQQVIASVRDAESRTPQGFHHLVFFEPSILWSGLGFDAAPPVGFSDDPSLVFSPHLYNESITMDQGLGVTLTTIEHGYTLAQRAAAAYDVPLWSGEWGWFGDIAKVSDRYERFLTLQNDNMLGSAVWVWKKSCGDPQTGAQDESSGGLRAISCPSGADRPNPAFLDPALAQAYPRSAPGRISIWWSSSTTVDMALSGSGNGTLDVWVPGTGEPKVSATGLTNVAVTAQPGGGWRVTGDASGDYALSAVR